jgi:ankyrin repeat protein
MSTMPAGHPAGTSNPAVAEILRSQARRQEIFGAAARGESERIAALLHNDPSLVRATGVDGQTPLHLAAQGGHRQAMEPLLAHGADPDARDAAGWTPLYLAARHGAPSASRSAYEAIELLLAHGAPLDLCAAAVLGRLERARELLDADPQQVNAPDAGGYTPLRLAIWNGQLPMAKLLLSRGAELEIVNERGKPPLVPGKFSVTHHVGAIHRLTLSTHTITGSHWVTN